LDEFADTLLVPERGRNQQASSARVPTRDRKDTWVDVEDAGDWGCDFEAFSATATAGIGPLAFPF
jgi:hypothetical protein